MKNSLRLLLILFSFAYSFSGTAQTVYTVNTSAPGVCDGSATLLDTLNTNPISIYWTGSGGVIQQGSYYIYGLCAGTYSVTYSDTSGISQTYTFNIQNGSGNPCAGFYAIAQTYPVYDTVNCDGMISIIPVGGSGPYSYSWGNPNLGNSSGATGLCAGSYYCIVTDQSGCSFTVQTMVIDSTNNNNGGNPCSGFYATSTAYPSMGGSSCDGIIEVYPVGGTVPYTYSSNSGITVNSGVFQNLCPGSYVITVADANGCYFTVSETVVDSSYYFPDSSNIISNPTFSDSTITDTLDYSWLYDCMYDLGSIDSAYVIGNSLSGVDSVIVTWLLVDSTGQVLGTYQVGYPTGGATGVVTVFLTVICPIHSPGDNALMATDQIYLPGQSATVGEIFGNKPLVINPFDDNLQLKFEKTADRSISLFDMKGALILKQSTSDSVVQLNANHLRKGVYILHVQEGTQLYQMKLVK
jgi:hypothetical protein